MKYFASLCAIVLAGSMPGFAASAHPTSMHAQYQNQFHFQPTKKRAAQIAAHSVGTKQAPEQGKAHGPASSSMKRSLSSLPASAKTVRSHTSNPPVGKTGLLAATDIPMGGGFVWNMSQAMSGDFNGDGVLDLTTVVENYVSGSWAYSVSVVLSKGDGTFQQAVLTPVPTNDQCATILVGDVNGDGKSDIVIGHQPGACGNSYSVPTLDVLISNGDGTFIVTANAVTISTSGLAGGTLADTNADGRLDIVAVDDGNPGSVWTLIGNGDGTFQPAGAPVALSGQAGYNTIIADLSGHNNGLLDIADEDFSTYAVTVYQQTAPGVYAVAVPYSDASSSTACYWTPSMAIGDLSGDGKPEIVTANCYYDNISVYVNNGDGTFQAGVDYSPVYNSANQMPGDAYPTAVTVADVTGDGKNDIVSSNDDGSDITILAGNGDGTVNTPTLGYAVGGYPETPAIVGDFNGDGFADIIVADSEYSFVYMKGYGDSTFRAAHDYYSAVSTNWGYSVNVATGDFNGDGYPDFAVGNCCDANMGVSVFISNPDGSLQPPVNYGSDGSMRYVAVADINGDKKLDLIATDDNGWVQTFTGVGDGTFNPGSQYPTDSSATFPAGLVTGDFNNDGWPDVAVMNANGQNVAILLNDTTGGFGAPVTYPLSTSLNQWDGNQLATADLAGTGKLDLLIPLYNGGAVAVLMGNGDGTFQPEADLTIPSGSPTGLTVADLNKDGKLDVAVTVYYWGTAGPGLYVALGVGDGTFQTPVPFATTLQDYNFDSPYSSFISSADIDGDGNPDLIYTNSEFGSVGILFGDGTGSFFDPVEFPSGGYNFGLAIADVNKDGAPDVVTAADDFAGVTVLLNNNGIGTLGTYSIAMTSQSGTVPAGTSASYTFTITPTNHYNGTITFSCPAGLPSLTSCSFQPSQVTLDGLNSQTVTLTITTKAATTSSRLRSSVDQQGNPSGRSSAMLLASLNGMGVFGMFLAGGFTKKQNRWSVLLVLALAMTFFLMGCGGSSNTVTPPPPPVVTPGTPTGSYSVTISGTGTAGTNGVANPTQTIKVNLTVQ